MNNDVKERAIKLLEKLDIDNKRKIITYIERRIFVYFSF